jgi:Cu/Ag efflux protein CusF
MRWITQVMLMLCGLWLSAAAAHAQPAGDAPAPAVETRARVMSVDAAADPSGKRYIRLQLVPRARLPFSTLTFRVRDAALLRGVAPGMWVKFTAERMEGENTLTALRVVEECKRFQPCD